MTKPWQTKAVQVLPFVLAIAVMLGAGYQQGVWSERWGTFPELQIFSKQLAEVPLEFGEWKGEEQATSDEKIRQISGAEGELIRTYRNANNDEVRVSLICARLQDIFYHTPDRCYPAAGFEMQGEPQPEVIDIGDTTAEFFTTSFLKSEPTGTRSERGFWSWTGDGKWIAPKNFKLALSSQKRALYKLYVFANVPSGKQKASNRDFSRDFIKAFIPVLNTALRPAMVQVGRITPEQANETTSEEAPTEEAKTGA